MDLKEKMSKWDALLAFAVFLSGIGTLFIVLGASMGNDIMMTTGGNMIFSIIAYYFGKKAAENGN